jgi:hypothetical protein
MAIPDNLKRLQDGEEMLRAHSLEMIEADEDLSQHVDLLEQSMDVIDYYVRRYKGGNEDEITLQLLGIRLFNGLASSFRLLTGGYYQNAAMIMRDIMETLFLLDYLEWRRGEIGQWRDADKKTRRGKFSPARIREALDKRSNLTGKKREQLYDLFCEYAAHPTAKGFVMLKPRGGNGAHCGPYFEQSALKAHIEELAKLSVQAGINVHHCFPGKTVSDWEQKIAFIEASEKWMERYYKRPFDKEGFDVLKAKLKEFETAA